VPWDDPSRWARFGGRVRDIVDPDGPPVTTTPTPRAELHRHTRRDGGMDVQRQVDAANAALLDRSWPV